MKQSKLLLAFVCFLSFSSLDAGYRMGVTKPEKIDSPDHDTYAESKGPSLEKTQDSTDVDETPVMQQLAKKFRIPLSQIEYYRERKYGYEELVPALIVSQAGGVAVGPILTARDRGNTWQQIAESYSINLKPLNKKVLMELKPIRKSLPKQYLEERPAFINDGK